MALLSSAASGLAIAAVTVLAFGLLVVIHEADHFAVARLCGMRVERFSVGYGPVLWSRRRGETEWALSALPFGGYVKIAGMAPDEQVAPTDRSAYSNQPAWRRFLVILAGPAMNYVAAVALAVSIAASVGLPVPDAAAVAGAVLPGGAGERAGLRPGDRVLAIDGRPIATWEELVTEVRAHPGEELRMEVRRAGEPAGAPPRVLVARPDDAGGVGRLGIGQHALQARAASPVEALASGVQRTNAKAGEILSGLGQVLSRKHRADELRGPLGIAQEMARSAQAGATAFLAMVWFISIALAMFNLLPVPALDGGRLVFLVYEIVTRRRVNQRVESIVHLAGFVALFGLLLAVTVFGDLARLFGR